MRMEWFIIKVLKFSLIDNVALSLGHSFSLIDVLNQNVVMRFTASFHGFSSQAIVNLLSKTGW